MSHASVARRAIKAYTLVEILVVLAIIALLMGLLVPVVSRALIKTRTDSTHVRLTRVGIAIRSCIERGGSFPLDPGGNQDITSATPGYFHSPCAPEGSASMGSETSKDLMKYLKGEGHAQPLSELHEGHLMDAFGNRIVIRFLRIPLNRADPDSGLTEVAVMWSYGPDRKNDVDATPSYTYQAGPDYDLDEYQRITEDDHGDDIVEIIYN